MTDKISPKKAQQNLFELLRKVNQTDEPVVIKSADPTKCAVILSLSQWNSLKETLSLENSSVGPIVRARELDDSGFTNIDEFNWHTNK